MMRGVRRKDTAPEMKLRRALWAKGLRYRLHRRALPGTPDVVFVGAKLAVFVHGCFWHGHDCAKSRHAPKTNVAYWAAKVAKNRDRDATAIAALSASGWRMRVVWECELVRVDEVADAIKAEVRRPAG